MNEPCPPLTTLSFFRIQDPNGYIRPLHTASCYLHGVVFFIYPDIATITQVKKPKHETAYFTACGQTAILENDDLAAALSRLSEQEQEELIAYYFQKKKQYEIAARYGRTRSTAG